MKVTLVGKEIVSYTKKGTGELKEGMSLYYTAPKDRVEGQCVDSIWLRKDTEIYNRMLGVNLNKPVNADVMYEMRPGSRFPELSGINIQQ